MNAFGKTHYLLLAAATLAAILGLYMLSTGLESSTALIGAPIVLFLAYVVMIPAAILWPKSEKNAEGPSHSDKV